jgi:perosamine synthetase
MKLPFYKPSLGPEEIEEVVHTLKSGWLTTGPKTKQFERDFGEYLRQKHAVAVNSCTAALHLALEAIGVKAGQTVAVPTMTFAATAEVVRYLGARPLLVDCRLEDFNLDVNDANRRIESALKAGEKVVAIMPVHYGGQIGDVAGVRALAEHYNLKVVEDAAHCCPAYYSLNSKGQGPNSSSAGTHNTQYIRPPQCDGERAHNAQDDQEWKCVGADADISCFSFYANKTITTGEGGMACTDNNEYAERMRIMSLHGISRDAWKRYTAEGSWYYEIIAPGYKYNMADIAAAIGIHQLRKADAFHRRRTELAALYHALLGNVEELILPGVQPGRIHSWHLYDLRLRLNKLQIDRARFITELQERGIGTSVHWMPLHMHPYYRDTYGYRPQDLPVAAGLYPELVTLPLYPDMTDTEARYVCDAIKEIIASNRRGKIHNFKPDLPPVAATER